MPRYLPILFTLATLSAAHAQSTDPVSQGTSPSLSSSQAAPMQAAPIERPYANQQRQAPPAMSAAQVISSQPIQGVWLHRDPNSSIETVSSNEHGTELRVLNGRVNVVVHHPADHAEILIDLPNGQTSLLKDGLYTFNGDTNTVRVLKGEAAAYRGPINSGLKPIKVKEDHQLAFTTNPDQLRSVDAYPFEIASDLLPVNNGDGARTIGYGYAGYGGGYGMGFYGDPYFGGGWGYPYGYGLGLGFGYGGGYYGGFRGGYGGFRGGYGGYRGGGGGFRGGGGGYRGGGGGGHR